MNTNAFSKDSRDPLWDLLGRAEPVEVSPLFARNVLREIRLAKTPNSTLRQPAFEWVSTLLRRRWRLALTACAVACVVAATSSVLFQDQNTTMALRAGDAEVISNLDELLVCESSSLWLKKQAY